MKFSIGDKVSFLNEKLSGTITRILNNGLCKVETDDGFEIDANENELVLISRIVTSEIPTAKDVIQPLLEKTTTSQFDVFNLLEDETLYFASMPSEDMQVLTGPVDFFLFNKTNYRLLFSFSVKIKNKIIGLTSGTIMPHSEFLLINKKRADTIDWVNFVVQAIFFNDGEYPHTFPLNRELPLLLPDLKIEFNTLKGPVAYTKTIKLHSKSKEPEIDKEELKRRFSKEELPVEIKSKAHPRRKSPSSETDDQLYGIIRNESEVDLHIQHLIDDYANLSNAEMLQIQLKKFRQEMDHALKSHYRKIIFIHGVGNGVLRTEILRELRSYDDIRFGDASFEKYGYGATEVFLD